MKYLPPLGSTSLFAVLLLAGLAVSCSADNGSASLESNPAEATEVTAIKDDSEAEALEIEDAGAEAIADGEAEILGDAAEGQADIEGVEQKNVKLMVDDQTTAGQIIVKTVATSRDGWVSVHQSREDGSIVVPESIGEARVDSGDSEDIIVDLWEAPEIGEKLWVLLHIDAGERGTYEFPGKDLPVKKNGETVARSFTIKGEETEEDTE